jgi:hypothetical protein
MAIHITLPVGLELRDWADQVILDLDSFGSFAKLMNDNEWQDWAVQWVANTGLGTYSPPNPYQFNDWQDWAERFVDTLS